jgi:hypothetical protein
MAEVFKRVNGQKITRIAALTREAQDGVESAAFDISIRAEGLLAAHRFEGKAKIDVDQGDVDRYVILDDSDDLFAALSIEFGRKPGPDGTGGMEGLAVLRRAAGLVNG